MNSGNRWDEDSRNKYRVTLKCQYSFLLPKALYLLFWNTEHFGSNSYFKCLTVMSYKGKINKHFLLCSDSEHILKSEQQGCSLICGHNESGKKNQGWLSDLRNILNLSSVSFVICKIAMIIASTWPNCWN